MIRRTRSRRGGRRRRTQKGGFTAGVGTWFNNLFGKNQSKRCCPCPKSDANPQDQDAAPEGPAAPLEAAPSGGKSRRKGRKSRRGGTRKGMRRKTARKAYKGLRRRRH